MTEIVVTLLKSWDVNDGEEVGFSRDETLN